MLGRNEWLTWPRDSVFKITVRLQKVGSGEMHNHESVTLHYFCFAGIIYKVDF